MKNQKIDLGLLIIRIGIGISFMIHGYPKLVGGVETWKELGEVMQMVGINFVPAFWGFMAAFAEFFGGLFLMLGLFFAPACVNAHYIPKIIIVGWFIDSYAFLYFQ